MKRTSETTKKEIVEQAKVLKELSGGDETMVVIIIGKIAPEMRDILNHLEALYDRPPTSSEIIWEIGVRHGFDPHNINKLLGL